MGTMAVLAQPARADSVDIATDLECGVETYYSELECGSLHAGIWSSESIRRFATLLKFDVAGNLPVGAEVTSATLHLNREVDFRSYDEPSDELSVYAMETPFTVFDTWFTLGGDDWNNPGTSDTPEDTVVPADGPLEWDVTALVSDWATSTLPNYGLAVADDESKYIGEQRSQFSSSENETVALRPYLEVEYTE
ncbi:DNRLRE domain-containing protein [Solirubrobacter phytolaccae]|uniref:DNRLRE domain-containing protein n=1 Tax=Solirubrobacter phytolaccae TaxID=1404360 RepID=A0A9X3NAJ9_9ACTN|nr:DNRLRE domain-containing protein [Solirubrobacter phytolaccae]MDA0181509.1 DNRLRE domain-containing protein [Solirubrobacter phytolaccae]